MAERQTLAYKCQLTQSRHIKLEQKQIWTWVGSIHGSGRVGSRTIIHFAKDRQNDYLSNFKLFRNNPGDSFFLGGEGNHSPAVVKLNKYFGRYL